MGGSKFSQNSEREPHAFGNTPSESYWLPAAPFLRRMCVQMPCQDRAWGYSFPFLRKFSFMGWGGQDHNIHGVCRGLSSASPSHCFLGDHQCWNSSQTHCPHRDIDSCGQHHLQWLTDILCHFIMFSETPIAFTIDCGWIRAMLEVMYILLNKMYWERDILN